MASIDSPPPNDGSARQDDSGFNPGDRTGNGGDTTSSGVSESLQSSSASVLHNSIAAHSHNGQCCNMSTSYIHVFHHASKCRDGQQHAGSTSCGENQKAAVDGEEEPTGKFGFGFGLSKDGPLGLFKQIIDNFKPDAGAKNGAARVSKDKEKTENFDPEDKSSDSADNKHESGEADENAQWEDDLVPPPPPVKKLWQGLEGNAVMVFGVVAPLLFTAMAMASCPKRITLVILSHPVETIIELLLLLAIPLANYRLWSAICKNEVKYSLRRGVLIGSSIATSLIIAGLSFAAIPAGYGELQSSIGTDFTTGFFFIGMQGLTTAAIGLYLMNRARLNREFTSTRARVLVYTMIGFLLGASAFTACEVRSWYVRIAEKQAMASDPIERAEGLSTLRSMNTERELRMETSDSRAAGIAGLFIPVKHSDMSKLYFTVTGKPFRDENSADFSSMSDDYLQRHVVGSAVKGLSLARSAFNGLVSADALTSTINWTFVFRNDTEINQEARAELALPPGAVINGLTVWKNGDPLDASFAAAGKAEGDAEINWVDVGHDNPAIVTDLGRGRYLFHCFPIPHDEQLKVNVSVVIPLSLEGIESTSLTLPRFIATNFNLDGEHNLTLESKDELASRAKNIFRSKGLQGRVVLNGLLEKSQLEHTPLVITARRAPDMVSVATFDKTATDMEIKRLKEEEEKKRQEEEAKRAADQHQVVLMIDGSRGMQQQIESVRSALSRDRKKKVNVVKKAPIQKYAVRNITEVVHKAPKRLLVVLDGSEAIKEHMPKVKQALEQVPDTVPVWLCVASRESNVLKKPTPLKSALTELDKIQFAGGQDNLKAVIQSAEIAGETEGGAVLWIHGPQPGLNKDIYIMSPFRAHPSFFELALDTGCTDTIEYFKNHGEVGPFMPIQRTAKLDEDLTDFFSKWQEGRREFVVSYSLLDKEKLPKGTKVLDGREKQELLILNSRNTVDNFLRAKQVSKAARIAVAYQFVSPVSCVTVISKKSYDDAPVLQGATNGTIGPQGEDATVIMGVNTAGTVRVNNLANLEALLNIICNLIEMAAMLFGSLIMLHGLLIKKTVANFLGLRARFTPGMRLALGFIIVSAGLAVPGLVNWFVASARDANLFS